MPKKTKKQENAVKPVKFKDTPQGQEAQAASVEPVSVAMGGEADYPLTRSRRNVASVTERSYKYKNIEDGFLPFSHDKNYNSGPGTVSVRESVVLAQKAYFNFPIVKASIDLAVDFSCTDIYLKGSTPKIRKFYEIWFDKIQLDMLKESFFLENLRSGNTFFYPYFCKFKDAIEIYNKESKLAFGEFHFESNV